MVHFCNQFYFLLQVEALLLNVHRGNTVYIAHLLVVDHVTSLQAQD